MRASAILVLALACAVSIEARQLKWDPYAKSTTTAYVEYDADAAGDGYADADDHSAYAAHDTYALSKKDGYGEGTSVSVGKSGDGEADAVSAGYSKTYGPAKAKTWGDAYADEDVSYAATKAEGASLYYGESETHAKSKAEGEEGEAETESKTHTYGPAKAYTDGTAIAKNDFAVSDSGAYSKSDKYGKSDAYTKATTEGDAGETSSESQTKTYGEAEAKAYGTGKVEHGKASASSSSSAHSKDHGKAYATNTAEAKADHHK